MGAIQSDRLPPPVACGRVTIVLAKSPSRNLAYCGTSPGAQANDRAHCRAVSAAAAAQGRAQLLSLSRLGRGCHVVVGCAHFLAAMSAIGRRGGSGLLVDE
jgi:hypothetical protein